MLFSSKTVPRDSFLTQHGFELGGGAGGVCENGTGLLFKPALLFLRVFCLKTTKTDMDT